MDTIETRPSHSLRSLFRFLAIAGLFALLLLLAAPAVAQDPAPALSVTKTADAATVNAGDAIGFVITVTNTGDAVASNVQLADALPTGLGLQWSVASSDPTCTYSQPDQVPTLACAFGDLNPGASKSVHITSPTTANSCAIYENTATVTAANHAQVVSPQASITVACTGIQIVKTADHSPVNAGDSIGFTIEVGSTGPGAAYGVVVEDPLPTNDGLNWQIDAQPAGAPCAIAGGVLTCNYSAIAANASRIVHITSGTTAGTCGIVENVAGVTTTNDGSGQAGGSIAVNCSDVAVTAQAVNATINAGDTAAFKMVVTNDGPGTAYGVTLVDTLTTGLAWTVDPAVTGCAITGGVLTCSFATLAAGASLEIDISATTSAAFCALLIPNAVTVGAGNETNTQNNAATATIAVECTDHMWLPLIHKLPAGAQ